jgi:hypothetical protein
MDLDFVLQKSDRVVVTQHSVTLDRDRAPQVTVRRFQVGSGATYACDVYFGLGPVPGGAYDSPALVNRGGTITELFEGSMLTHSPVRVKGGCLQRRVVQGAFEDVAIRLLQADRRRQFNRLASGFELANFTQHYGLWIKPAVAAALAQARERFGASAVVL